VKRKFIAIFIIFFIWVPFALKAGNKPDQKRIAIGFDFGYLSTTGSNLKNGFSPAINLQYFITPHFRIELRSGALFFPVENDPKGLTAGNLTTIPIQLSLQYSFNLGKRLAPYLSLGAGYYLNFSTIEDQQEWNNLDFEIEEKPDHNFGFHGGLGVAYRAGKKMALTLDVRYCLSPLSGTYTLKDLVSGETASGTFEQTLDHLAFYFGFLFFL